jgi:DnaJ-domain-containing protein 1
VTRALLLLVLAIVVLRLVRAVLEGLRRSREPGSQSAGGAGAFGGPGASPDDPRGWDPHAVLGVARDASRDEIAQAYRAQLKRYHPDRVADLGPELQRVAHQKTVELQRAYAELTRRAAVGGTSCR